jgi:hypothetical protein
MDPKALRDRTPVSKASNKTTAPTPEKPALDPGQNHLRKLAAEELSKMQERAPEQYLHLRRHYIESLDQHKRQILQELESRSKASQFDAQLRPGLIRFMVDNPAMWTGVTSARGQVRG